MDAKEAVSVAKNYVSDLFGADDVADVRLEEIEHDERDGIWSVTLSFLRRAEQKEGLQLATGFIAALEAINAKTRVLRVVTIRDVDSVVLAVKQQGKSRDAA